MLRAVLIVILLLAGFAALTLWRAGAREAASEAAYPPEGRLIEVNGHPVHVVERGQPQGSAPDLVLIHGASGSTRDLTFALSPALEDRYRILIFDRPGLGYTPALRNGHGAPAETLQEQAALLQGAAAQMGADRPIVAGQSYGGAVALAWAIHHPEALSALVPIAAASNPWDTPLDPLYKLTSSRAGSALVVPLITAWVPGSYVTRSVEGVFAPQSAPDGYGAHFGPGITLRRATFRANARQRRDILAQIKAQHLRNSEITVPTEIVHGTADTTVALRIHSAPLAEQIRGAVLTPLDGIGHMPQHVAVPEVAAAIDRAAARARLR